MQPRRESGSQEEKHYQSESRIYIFLCFLVFFFPFFFSFRYLESTGLKSGGCLELRRTPHPVAVHLASERELVADEVLNSVHSTKRMVVDLSGTGADAMRDFQVLFAAAMKKSRDEYALCVYNQQPGEGSWKTEFISLNRTLWEQGLLPNGVVVLYPVSQILVASVKVVYLFVFIFFLKKAYVCLCSLF